MEPILSAVILAMAATAAQAATPALITATIAVLEAIREYIKAQNLPEGRLKADLQKIDAKIEVLRALIPDEYVRKVEKVRKTAKKKKTKARSPKGKK